MGKPRGINICPYGIGALLAAEFAAVLGEYDCRVETLEGCEEVTAVVEVAERGEGLAGAMAARLRKRLGVGILVQLVGPGLSDDSIPALGERLEVPLS